MSYQSILFDLDGTLLDTLYDLYASVNATLRQFGRPERTMDEVRRFTGNGAEHLIRCALPDGAAEHEVREALAWYQSHYAAHCRDNTKPYAGIMPMLERLHEAGKLLAVVSNKPDRAVKLLSAEHFQGLMRVSIGEGPGKRRKPWPDTVDAALEELGSKKADAVYIGDSEVDAATAKNAGLPLIAVSWGFRSRDELRAAGAERIADTPEELLALLLA